ncbi:MAG TPA: N-acetylmuramoyl-L-alanine amidase [Gammaproteobacteria bacterium]|nr:N-acetylmuramoyl-L-alanine amidase [Gammaproteobacteria bacterium]
MNRSSKIRNKVLRAVYEDNAGIPRTFHDSRRPGAMEAPPVADRGSTGHRSRGILILVLGIVSLVGMSFRLVTVDVKGPVAKQMVDRQSLQYLTSTVSMTAGQEDALTLDHDGASLEPALLIGDSDAGAARHYENLIARLGMPMADLFNLKVGTIVIDPGHGGIDPGATGHQGLMEKDVALDIAKRLRDKLVKSGNYRVLLTRDRDRKVFLKERVAFAKDNKADLFISIHINSLPPEGASLNFVETYHFGQHTDQRSLELAEKENHASDYAMGDFREVIARIGDTLKTEESRVLASAIHRRLYSNLKKRNRDLIDAGSKTGPFMVLLGVEVPSVLVEVSCISNKAEETRLSKPEYRDNVAGFLQAGIVEYLEQRGYRRSVEGGKIQHVAEQER